jgi:hypothetical protein
MELNNNNFPVVLFTIKITNYCYKIWKFLQQNMWTLFLLQVNKQHKSPNITTKNSKYYNKKHIIRLVINNNNQEQKIQKYLLFTTIVGQKFHKNIVFLQQ